MERIIETPTIESGNPQKTVFVFTLFERIGEKLRLLASNVPSSAK